MTTHDQFADAYEEAVLRENADGIPRYVTSDNKIMKYDWELDLDDLQDALVGDKLEEYVSTLLEQQS